MARFTEKQIDFLLTFFEDDRYPGWKSIANKLIEEGRCVVPGDNCIWEDGVGDFIKTEIADGYYGCLVYMMNIDDFIASKLFKETYDHKVNNLRGKISEIEKELSDIISLTH